MTATDWTARIEDRLKAADGTTPETAPWRRADAATVRLVLRGVSPYSGTSRPEQGARVVFNISSAHIPAFVGPPPGGGYKNRHAVALLVGSGPPNPHDMRSKIDDVLSRMVGISANDLHYGAVELNGAGVRYYGDVCLVLKPDAVDPETNVIDRNSFDLICEPLRALTVPDGVWDAGVAGKEAAALAGEWKADLPALATCKVLEGGPSGRRRITIGSISEGVLRDEDYIEVLWPRSFTASEVGEARTTATDAATEALIRDRLGAGPVPEWAALKWRRTRRRAEAALREAHVPVRIVTGPGRLRP